MLEFLGVIGAILGRWRGPGRPYSARPGHNTKPAHRRPEPSPAGSGGKEPSFRMEGYMAGLQNRSFQEGD